MRLNRFLGVLGVVLVVGCEDDGGGSGGGRKKIEIQCGEFHCDECCREGECASETSCDLEMDPVLTFFCDGPEDCSEGETCCAGIPAGSFPLRAECNPAAECAQLPLQFCHEDEDCGDLGTCEPMEDATYMNVCTQES
jgi:hypothetical protein